MEMLERELARYEKESALAVAAKQQYEALKTEAAAAVRQATALRVCGCAGTGRSQRVHKRGCMFLRTALFAQKSSFEAWRESKTREVRSRVC
jgi:hypothetical protein